VAVSEHDAYLELCAGQALDALSAEDRARLEAHLEQGCSECEAALAAYADAKVGMAATAPAAAPRAKVKEDLLARVARETQHIETNRPMPEMPRRPDPGTRAPWGLVWGLAAFALLFLVLNVWNWQRASLLLRERNFARTEVVRITRELEDAKRVLAVVNAPEAQLAVLLPTQEANQSFRGAGYFDPATGNTFLVFRHLDRPPTRDYQLWALHGDKPTSLGLLTVDANGRATVELRGIVNPAHLSAFAVSMEPSGGSPRPGPTGPVVLVGTIGG
jgi:anti-sigma-K factor RskA